MTENIIQYRSRNGYLWVALDPESVNRKDWVIYMINKYGFQNLMNYFPYVNLYINPKDGKLDMVEEKEYDARITNFFYIAYFSSIENSNMFYDKSGYNPYANNYNCDSLSNVFFKEQPKNEPVYEINQKDIVFNKDDVLYEVSNDILPETIKLQPINKWHPNKDANGNYIQNGMYQQNPSGYNPYYTPVYGNSRYPF